MNEPIPELSEELKASLLNVVIADFSYYVSVCMDECFTEFFRVSDLTEATFFTDVMISLQVALGVYWWAACEFIAEQTSTIQKAVFAHPWTSLNAKIPN
ncbi:hypothetical protein [Vibrio europaeus]|uniref:hypothetical protein n=1 Tax=Vibrio europaeus TaxID=300876 RepID=UPI00233F3303|nr:hypothetical protein [Vibrio europaeus]MDC5753589.1 hypothetical protein [Vibrio europaeus]MDC5816498.1 hypothetical protein [Vibrio europaeus]